MKILWLMIGMIAVTALGANQPAPAQPALLHGKYVIDVRTDEEWNAGHVQGAIHLPVGELQAKIGTVIQDKAAPIGCYCGSGMRAGRAVKILKQLGYSNAENLGGLQEARKKLDAAK